ncbi:MAG: L-seryl-tRNA(Sec) selenium transferase, partial [Gemmatimonadota bacterium]
ALRVDKLTIAALEATLMSYQRGTARADIPVLRMISAPAAEIRDRAARLVTALQNGAQSIEGFSVIGGGAYPDAQLPTWLVVLQTPNAAELAARLRSSEPPVIARIADDRVVLDLRTVLPEQAAVLIQILKDV